MSETELALESLRAIVGASHVLTDPDAIQPFTHDWTNRWTGHPVAVVRPSTTEEVSAVMRECARTNTVVVAQGGNTWLVAGSVAPPRSVLLSTTRLVAIDAIDRDARQVTAEAGVTIAALQKHARAAGLDYGVDLGSRDSATIGGTVATNAGGIRVVCRGDTRSQVLGVEAVLADGSVTSHLAGLPKDSAGYDLSNLLVGSEGTLAILTKVRVRLCDPLPEHRSTLLVGVASIADALEFMDGNRERGLLAAEFMTRNCMELVCRFAQLPDPLAAPWPFYLLLETTESPALPTDADAVLDRRVWAYRERQTDSVSSLGQVHKLDVGVPLRELAECVTALPEVVSPHQVFVFGHLAEGNLHVEIVGPPYDDDTAAVRVLDYVASVGGTISAEHGVGRAKAPHLHLSRDSASIAAMRAIKGALDPQGLLNPGAVLV